MTAAQVVSPAGTPVVEHPSLLTRRLHAAVVRYAKVDKRPAPGELIAVERVDQGLGEAWLVSYERTYVHTDEVLRSLFLVVDVHAYREPGQIEETYAARVSDSHRPEDLELLIRSCYIGPMVQVVKRR